MSPGIRHEHEYEAQHGLPERLPAGERLLWQGAPTVGGLARQAFHLPAVAVYFGILLALRGAAVAGDGAGTAATLQAVLGLGVLFAFALAALWGLAWGSARTTAYTITDRRVVMRIGIVLSVTYNLPFSRIEGATFAARGQGGSGDIAIALLPADRIAFLHLWPHVRPWRVSRTQPMLRCLADGERVAWLLTTAWRQSTGAATAEAREPQGAESGAMTPVLVPR